MILLIELSLQIDQGIGGRDFLFLLRNEIGVELVRTESALKLIPGSIGDSLAINFDGLKNVLVDLPLKYWASETYKLHVIEIFLFVGLLKRIPSFLG